MQQMSRKMSKTKWVLMFIVVFACLGYCREFFFVHYNLVMYEVYYNSESQETIPGFMKFFRQFSYDSLYYAKYIYTLIWVFLFYISNHLALKKLGAGLYFPKILLYSYIIMLGVAALSMAYGYFVNNRLQDEEYTLSRWLLGIAQSPIICLILLASQKLYTKSFPS